MSEIPQQVLACAIATRTPVLLWGPPGIGKTATIRSLAETMGLPLEIVIAAIHEPADFSGLPYPDGDRVRYLTPDWAVRLAEAGHGVLFLDELTEFRRDALEALRQPLEDGRVVVARAGGAVEFPARFTLVAAANPCPCGYLGDPRHACRCPPNRVDAYRQKLSGPLLDRIDLRLAVPRLSRRELLDEREGEPSSSVRERVALARERQRYRYAGLGVGCNGQLPGPLVRREARLAPQAERLLVEAVEGLGLTGRGFDRALRVARTIADLAGSERVEADHLAEALSYRAPVDEGGMARAG